ncbi:MAG: hypothetical protein HRT45_16575 [Bdellovibrionales bacterium]|nr:hypothetical protein [Bdellovibrionales bacterium]
MTKERRLRVKKLAKTVAISASVFVVMMGFQNCASEHSSKSANNGSAAPSVEQLLAGYEAASKAIFAESCNSCHAPDSLVEDVPFDSFETSFLIQNNYIVPGEPQNSPLYLAVLDGLMPHETEALSVTELETLRDWIQILGDPSGSGSIIRAPGDEGDDLDGDTVPTFSGIYSTIIDTHCISCHGPAQQRGGARFDSYSNLMRYIDVDNPRDSRIFIRINRGEMPDPNGFNQPTRGRYANAILEWVEAGAPNN